MPQPCLQDRHRKGVTSVSLWSDPARRELAGMLAMSLRPSRPPVRVRVIVEDIRDNLPALGLRQRFVGINAVKSLQQNSNLFVFHCLFPFAAPLGAH